MKVLSWTSISLTISCFNRSKGLHIVELIGWDLIQEIDVKRGSTELVQSVLYYIYIYHFNIIKFNGTEKVFTAPDQDLDVLQGLSQVCKH